MQTPIILCATDLEASGKHAVELARSLTEALAGELHLAHVAGEDLTSQVAELPPSMQEVVEKITERLQRRREHAANRLETERQQAEAPGIPCKATLLHGRSWDAIVEEGSRCKARYLVVGAHASNPGSLDDAFYRNFLGTTAARIVRHADCSVWVAPTDRPSLRSLKELRWLVAIDFSPESRVALLEAAGLVRQLGGTLILAHVLSAPWHETDVDRFSGMELVVDSWKQERQQQLASFAAEATAGLRTELCVEHGRVAEQLARVAKVGTADVAVVGTHGRSGISRALLGSDAENCLKLLQVPVLVCKSARVTRPS